VRHARHGKIPPSGSLGPKGLLKYRRAVPPRLQPIIGKQEIHVAFRSKDLKAVMQRYFELEQQINRQFQNAEARLAAGATEPLSLSIPRFDVAALGQRITEALRTAEQARRAAPRLRAMPWPMRRRSGVARSSTFQSTWKTHSASTSTRLEPACAGDEQGAEAPLYRPDRTGVAL
jgi:hypothetical protein